MHCAEQILSMEWSSPFFAPLSYYIISSQEDNSVPKGCSYEDFLLRFEVQGRPCRWCNHLYGVEADYRLLSYSELAQFALQPKNLCSTAQGCACSG